MAIDLRSKGIMIDSHCHLETMENVKDVVEQSKKAGLRALISVATHPSDFNIGLRLSSEYKDFVFLGAGIHPEFIKEFNEDSINSAFQWLSNNANSLVGIGEQGLDYFWVREAKLREKQKNLFSKTIELTKELDKVKIVHTREAYNDVIEILEKQHAERVQLHMWGEHSLVNKIIDNGWYISVGPIVARSKNHRKVVRDMPIEQLLLETDSPWFGGKDTNGKSLQGRPANIIIPSEEIAKIKEMEVEEVMKICQKNAIRLFRLPFVKSQ